MAGKTLQFTNWDSGVDARVDELLARMSLEEKVGQMCQIHIGSVTPAEGEERIRQGRVGSVLTLYGAAEINRMQRVAVEETRLGIPLILGNDVIHGYRTIFPIPLAESCTWDPTCWRRRPASRPRRPRPTARTGFLRRWWTSAATHAGAASPRARGKTRSWEQPWPGPGCAASRQRDLEQRPQDRGLSQALCGLWRGRSRQGLQHGGCFGAHAARCLSAAIQGRL